MSEKELDKKYDHKQVENGKYDWWVEKGFFKAHPESNKPKFSIILPPPNVTGKLHIGHAWDGSLQDALIRYKKLSGFDTLYVPGMDHAGIATQTKVEARLREQGINRFELGREKFLDKVWEWKEEYATTIRSQWKTLGLSLDYSMEKFTMDEDVDLLVRQIFVDMYNKGLIYKGKQIVNWDPQQETAISNIEVIYKNTPGKMYYFKYFLVDNPNEFLTVATTRPETMFGDQCVVVNPNDDRYKKYVGKEVINPVNGEHLPVIADDYVDVEFGTGVMKATPAHDQNDFEIAKRHNLDMPIIMTTDAKITEAGGKEYAGLDRFDAREKIIKNTTKDGTFIKAEDIMHEVGYSERSNAIVEPYLSTQWFVKMQPLADMIMKLQDSKDAIKFFPERFNHTLETWMENIHDWTISRQLWWGHRIPVWYNNNSGEMFVGVDAPKDIENWTQDPDVLDTWFSSGLWPFATMNWKFGVKNADQNEYFKNYFPESVLVTGYDIIFFWVARMIFQTLEQVGEKPFDDVLIHGLVRDSQGRKMSKSLGNGIDPMDVVENYGADSLRFFLLTNSTPGQDVRYSDEKIGAAWNFINKLWNASRFVLMNLGEEFKPWTDFSKEFNANKDKISDTNKWILNELSELKANVIEQLDKYEFGIAGRAIYDFIWNKYCSWFIEFSKVELNSIDEFTKEVTKQTLFYVLKEMIILLHPFTPFVTEEIYQHLNLKESIMEEIIAKDEFKFETKYINYVIEMITALRDFRLNNEIKKETKLTMNVTKLNNDDLKLFKDDLNVVNKFLLDFTNSEIEELNVESKDATSLPFSSFFLEINNESFFDLEKELKELNEKKASLEQELERSKKMLSNENFIKKADPAKVEVEKEKQANYQSQYDGVIARLKELNK